MDGMVIIGHRSSKSTFGAYSFFLHQGAIDTQNCVFSSLLNILWRGGMKKES